MEEAIFKLNNVYFSYLGKYPALCGVSMDILKGQKITILGANGSGKSTLLQLLDGLIFPDKGSIFAFDRQLNEEVLNDEVFSRKFRSKVGFVFQNPDVQLFCPTVEEDISFGPLHLGVNLDVVKKRVNDLADSLGIMSLLRRSAHQLSVGEKRKVAIASTLAVDPEVLLLDEPTAGLDPQTARHIIDIIIEANARGKTIITATHDLHIVEEIADTIYIMSNEKKIAKSGATQVLLADLDLLKTHNLMHVHRHKHKDEAHIHSHQHLDHHS